MKKNLIIFISGLFLLFMGIIGERMMNTDQTKNKRTYLALGDSYTIGEKVSISERWPVRLVKKLADMGMEIEDPTIIATTGWTTGELIDGINKAELSGAYDLVSLLIGVNNQYRGNSISEFRTEFIQLLNTAIKLSGNRRERVFVLSIPDWGVMQFAKERNSEKITEEIDLFNKVSKEETEKMGIGYFDITGISRKAEKNPALIAVDSLHPSGKMYRLWVEKIAVDVAALLRKVNGE